MQKSLKIVADESMTAHEIEARRTLVRASVRFVTRKEAIEGARELHGEAGAAMVARSFDADPDAGALSDEMADRCWKNILKGQRLQAQAEEQQRLAAAQCDALRTRRGELRQQVRQTAAIAQEGAAMVETRRERE